MWGCCATSSTVGGPAAISSTNSGELTACSSSECDIVQLGDFAGRCWFLAGIQAVCQAWSRLLLDIAPMVSSRFCSV